jgi:hypothetical protein
VHTFENRAVEAEADGALLEDDVVLGAVPCPGERPLMVTE